MVVVVCVCVLLLVPVLTVGVMPMRAAEKCRKCVKTNEKIRKNIKVRVY